MVSVTPSILVTSVLNPNMRVFDVAMRTEYGTSYNSYVVIGSEKIALIEAAHADFLDVYFAHLDEALEGRTPDYLVLNHTEPDHTGTVAALLERYPELKIVISRSGALFLKSIVNRDDLDCLIVSDGEVLDLGERSLQFICAPLLHWPDTMFTYCPEERTVFTCDFLGSHYCEPDTFDVKITYPAAYLSSAKHYFDSIMSPFSPAVRCGLDKVRALDVDYVCVSHGPILTRGCELERQIARYSKWATETGAGAGAGAGATGGSSCVPLRVPVFFCSAYGNTAALAEHIATGIRAALAGATVELYDLIEYDLAELRALMNASDAFALGTPTVNRDALGVVWELLAGIEGINFAKRPVAVFGSYGWSGEGVPHVVERLASMKAAVFEQQLRVKFVPTAADLAAAEDFGRQFAATITAAP
ncbi:MAG: FprA family A-type flavoprotein [Coriobacteriia bacterium]|nr:FprA family A-type flavoprotein [Coriobacteriia bacterium]